MPSHFPKPPIYIYKEREEGSGHRSDGHPSEVHLDLLPTGKPALYGDGNLNGVMPQDGVRLIEEEVAVLRAEPVFVYGRDSHLIHLI